VLLVDQSPPSHAKTRHDRSSTLLTSRRRRWRRRVYRLIYRQAGSNINSDGSWEHIWSWTGFAPVRIKGRLEIRLRVNSTLVYVVYERYLSQASVQISKPALIWTCRNHQQQRCDGPISICRRREKWGP